jgi:hypothetical protein
MVNEQLASVRCRRLEWQGGRGHDESNFKASKARGIEPLQRLMQKGVAWIADFKQRTDRTITAKSWST